LRKSMLTNFLGLFWQTHGVLAGEELFTIVCRIPLSFDSQSGESSTFYFRTALGMEMIVSLSQKRICGRVPARNRFFAWETQEKSDAIVERIAINLGLDQPVRSCARI
jgi:hypothetical protein